MTLLLRGVAVAIAVLALIDPALATRRPVPLPVEVLLPPESDPGFGSASARVHALEGELGGRVSTVSAEPPRARISLGGAPGLADPSVPLFVLRPERPPGITISRISTRGLTASGQAVGVEAVVRADRLNGRTSTILLLDRGVVVARREQAWTGDEEERAVRLDYAAPSTGLLPLEVRVETAGVEAVTADVAAVIAPRSLRVLIFEPRPSWAAAFIRRTLEGRSEFTVAALSRSAPRVATRLDAVPASLDALQPGDFDVLIVGAPEELRPSELEVLDRFASVRGGAVLLVPDTRVSPAVQKAFALPRMDERLLETPATIQAGQVTLQASEILVAPAPAPSDAMATVALDGARRAAIVSAPRGDGTIVLSGLLDAWRYRSAAGERFWRGLVADLAVASPAPLTMEVDPALARTGDRVRVTARWRRDQITEAERVGVPALSASITDPGGRVETLRLWPGGRAGVLEGVTTARGPGTYRIAGSGAGTTAEAALRVHEDVVHAAFDDRTAEAAAERSGGAVVGTAGELRHLLERLPALELEASTHPMRSPWWIVPFAGCLFIEWLIRRKRGLR